VRRGLQDHELVRLQLGGDGLGRRDDVPQVGRARLGQRRRHADRQRVEPGDHVVVRAGRQLALEARVAVRGHVDEVGAPLLDRADAVLGHVDADDVVARLGEGHRERESGVAEADHADPGLVRGNPLVERRCGGEYVAHTAQRNNGQAPPSAL
jgi:hypothetical protein